jgi:parvulin-like peptidyl-prolyl isomerase
MRRIGVTTAFFFCLSIVANAQNGASRAGAPSPAVPQQPTEVDGIAARIGNDVLTDSEVRELQDYQKLVEGQAQDRSKVMEELVDQWIVQTEAVATKFPHPTADEVSLEFQALLKLFPSREQFQARLAQIGLTQDEVRQVLERQLYYIRFLNYKFHAATQVTSEEVETYYQQDLAPSLRKRGLTVPPLDQVEAQIRQLLTQEEINEKAAQWLDEAKARLRIVIQPSGRGG